MSACRIIAPVFALLASVLSCEPLLAQAADAPEPAGQQENGPTRRLNMGVGRSIIIDLPRDASEIFIGNPKVAQAVVRSPRKLYLIGAEPGQTTIFALDKAGRQIVTLEMSVGRDTQDLDRLLKTAFPTSSIVVRSANDTIILTGAIDSAREAQQAVDMAAGYLGQSAGKVVNSMILRGQDQVMVKVTIAEVKRDVMKQLGVGTLGAAGSWGKLAIANAFGLGQQPQSSLSVGRSNLNAALQAMERYGVARILAEPTVTAVSGESAKFTAGGEVPFPTGQNCTVDPATNRSICSAAISFRPYGVTLNFTPVVLAEGRILLRVATEVTEVDSTQTYNYGGAPISGFLTRKNETTVELASGASIASAGLIQTRSRQVLNGVPGLMNLPVLGAMFRSRDYQREESELMIVVTPVLAKAVNPADLPKPTDNLVDANDAQGMFLGRVNRLYSSAEAAPIGPLKGRVGFIHD